MKHTLFILALITATIQTFAQSPRIKLNQITKDSVTGSVLVSSPTDSGMVYSRDLFISYGADTVLILGGDTLAATSSIISSVLSDGVTITGDGTTGSELTADTSVLATLRALSDSLALVSSSVTADNITITGDGTVGSPLKVDTTTYIATKQDLDLYYLDSNPDGYTSNTGTVTSVAATAGTGISVSGSPITTSGTLTITNTAPDQTVSIAGGGINAVTGTYPSFTVTGTEVDGDASNELQTLSYNSSTNEITLSDGGGTEDLSNLDLVDSTRINATGDTAYYYQNGVLIGTGPIAGGGGTTYNNITEGNDTVYISDHLDVDTSTLYVDATNNRVGIGTSTPNTKLTVQGDITDNIDFIRVQDPNYDAFFTIGSNTSGNFFGQLEGSTDGYDSFGAFYKGTLDDSRDVYVSGRAVSTFQSAEYTDLATRTGPSALENANAFDFANYNISLMMIQADGDVGIGTTSPSEKLEVNGKVKISDLTGTGGNAVYENGGVLGVASDARFKNYIGDIDNGIQKVLNLKPKYFVDNRNSTFQQLGFYAQEVKSVINEASYPIGNTDYLGINDRAIIAVTVKAIQEQQTIIESQANEIEQLKTLITELSNRLTILENN